MAPKDTSLSGIEDKELDEEPGEEIDSAPPLKVGEEREVNSLGLKKRLLKSGNGWETPEFGDEVTVHYVGCLIDGTKFDSSRDGGEPLTFKLGHGQVVTGLDHGIITMKKGELALFTLPSGLGYGSVGTQGVPPDSEIQFEVELISWVTVMDVCKDGGIIKRILLKGVRTEKPGDLDEVKVRYEVKLADGSHVVKTPEEGLEFYLKDGHLCPALPKVIKTMGTKEKAMLTVGPQYAFGEDGRNSAGGFSVVPSNATLNIDLELVSFKPVIDVSGDSGVLKKILREGECVGSANEGAAVRIRYTAMLEDGTVFEKKGYNGEEPFEFAIDEEQVITGLDQTAVTMKKGELSVATIKPEYGFGKFEAIRELAIVPANSTIIYEVEMVDFTKEKEAWMMNSREKIQAAEWKKEEGNFLFKSEKYQRAMKKYEKATNYLNDDDLFEDDERKLVKTLRVSCWLNSAACSLKLTDFMSSIRFTSKVLDIESQNVKALYRRAQAYMQTADLDLAELDVKKALEVDPQNWEVKSMCKTLKQMQMESNKRDAKLYGNMFVQMRKDIATESKRMKVEKAEKREEHTVEEAMGTGKLDVSAAQKNHEMVVDSC